MDVQRGHVSWYQVLAERAALIAVLALIWEFGVEIFGIKPYLLPRLSAVLQSLWANRTGVLFQSLVTTKEIVIGYLAAVLGGILLSLMIYAWPLARRTIYPLAVLFQGVPKIALAPLIIIW